MKYIALLSLCFFTGLRMASAQDRNIGTECLPGKIPTARNITEMENLRLKSGSWMLDSAWYSQWLTSITDWYTFQKEYLHYTASAQMAEDLFRTYNMNTGQWENANRYLHLFSGSGNLSEIRGQAWYPAGQHWVDYSSTGFDDQGRMDTMYYKQYDPLTNRFTFGFMNLFYYGASNVMTENVSQSLDTATGTWVNTIRNQYTFSATLQMTELLVQMWNLGTGSWDNSQKTEYTYDPSGFSTGNITYTWVPSTAQWQPEKQVIQVSNASGQVLSLLYKLWNVPTSGWQNSEQTTYQYYPSGPVSDILDQLWNTSSSAWRDNWKDHYTYYQNNMQKARNSWQWNPLGSVWMDTWYSLNDSLGYNLEYFSKTVDPNTYTYLFGYRYLYSYNTGHQLEEYENQSLETASGNWVPSGKRIFTYDPNGNNTVQLDQVYNQGGGTWDNFFKLENFFSIFTGLSQETLNSCHCLFANPMTKGQNIHCFIPGGKGSYLVSWINLNGQTMGSRYFREGETLMAPENLPSGIYLMQVLENGKLLQQYKIVLRD